MAISKIFYSLVVASLLVFSNASKATVYDFGSLLTLSSSYNATNSFASSPFSYLSEKNDAGGVWSFLLTVNNNLFSSFGNSAFIGSTSFDFTPAALMKQPATTFIDSNVGGVILFDSTGGTGLIGLTDIDFVTSLGKSSGDRLSGSDWVEWSASGLTPGSNMTDMYLHVQGINVGAGKQGYSAKYTPTASPVPEPDTYAMLLAGIGLIGFSIRRRNQNN